MKKNKIVPAALFLLLALGLWHLFDVRAGAYASGDVWLVKSYVILWGLFLGSAGAMGWLLLYGKKKGGETALWRIYPAAGLCLGLAYMAVFPPMSAPDEISHYVSAYELSSRLLGTRARHDDGNVLVRFEDWFLEDVYGNYRIGMEGDYYRKIGERASFLNELPGAEEALADREAERDAPVVLGQKLTESTYRTIHDVALGIRKTPQQQLMEAYRNGVPVPLGEEGGGTALLPDTGEGNGGTVALPDGEEESGGTAAVPDLGTETAVTAFPPVSTTPAAYFPQALGIAAARLLRMDSLGLAWMGRLFNLFFFVAVTTLAIRRLPFGREVLFGTALLPMTLHLSASYSYDVMILACVFLFTAVCLDLAYVRERVRVRDVALLAVLIAVAGPCKMIYAPVIGLCLLVPVKKFGGFGRWILSAAVVLGAYAAAMLLVNREIMIGYATVPAETALTSNGEEGFSLSLLLHRPGLLLQMFYNTLVHQTDEYHLTMIGERLGNLDPVLNVPYPVVLFFTAALIGLALKTPGDRQVLTGGRRIWVFALCAACGAAAMLSMLIACTPRSSNVIEGVQGRYFLPFLPAFLLACKNDWLVLTKNRNRSILYLMYCANLYVLLRIFSVVCMRL